jgi:hypothetical protein
MRLLICAAALAVTGCGSGSGGTGSGVAHPSLEKALGLGVTVLGPGSYRTGNDSPGAAVSGMVTGLESGDLAKMCGYFPPSSAASCRQALSRAPSGAISSLMLSLAGEVPRISNFSVGYTAIKGDEALAVILGTSCGSAMSAASGATPGAGPTSGAGPTAACITSSDPAAGLDSGASFGALWAAANSGSDSGQTALAPLIRVNGKWYVDSAEAA